MQRNDIKAAWTLLYRLALLLVLAAALDLVVVRHTPASGQKAASYDGCAGVGWCRYGCLIGQVLWQLVNLAGPGDVG